MSTLVLVFDTETDRKWESGKENPYLMQLSYIVYDTNERKIVKVYNKYIKQEVDIDFTSEAFKINNITKKDCETGVSVSEAIVEFYHDYMQVEKIIAHNVEFDKKVMIGEMIRNHYNIVKLMDKSPYLPPTVTMFRDVYNENSNIMLFCTMYSGKNITNITMEKSNGKGTFLKSPKLIELYQTMFNETPENLHDALIDSVLCLRCYIKMRFKYTIPKSELPCLL
jgi:DNA polymerase III epsilon subunit-like protein